MIALDRIFFGTDPVDYFVGFDPAVVGKLEAQYLVDRATGSGNPLYLYSFNPSSDYYTQLLLAGAWSVLQPKIADGTFVIRNSSAAAALQNKPVLTPDEWVRIMEQVGATHPDASGYVTVDAFGEQVKADLAQATAADKANLFVLGVDDLTAQVVGFELAADPDVRNFILTGSGAEKSAIQNIIAGRQSMTVLFDERLLTGDAVAIAEDYLQGKTPPQVATYLNVPATLSGALTVVDLGNIRTALIDSGYYKAGDFTGLP